MATLTIRNLDDSLKHSLRVRAAENGVSMEEEARVILRDALLEAHKRGYRISVNSATKPAWHLDVTLDELLGFGEQPEHPVDLKKLSDEMWDESL